ncbi:hypothetical protein NDA16_002899 [Ustilago loliicola]|nr:hypothetical protein NDA16_002899 [Ustilago loliicola]
MVAAATAIAAANIIASDKPRSLNRSCIQCRERKIKCDRLDPCSQCIAKDASDECKRELRKKRAKNKRPFPKRKDRAIVAESDNIASSTLTSTATSVARVSFSTAVSSGSDDVPMLTWAEQPITSGSHYSEPSSYAPSTSSGKVITPITPNTSSA